MLAIVSVCVLGNEQAQCFVPSTQGSLAQTRQSCEHQQWLAVTRDCRIKSSKATDLFANLYFYCQSCGFTPKNASLLRKQSMHQSKLLCGLEGGCPRREAWCWRHTPGNEVVETRSIMYETCSTFCETWRQIIGSLAKLVNFQHCSTNDVTLLTLCQRLMELANRHAKNLSHVICANCSANFFPESDTSDFGPPWTLTSMTIPTIS